MFKKKKKIDFAKLKPLRQREFETLENGNVSVNQPRFFNSFFKKYADKFLKNPDVKVRLDGKGSLVWNMCDGKNTIADIALEFEKKFNDGPVYERLQEFILYLEKCEMISYVNLKELEEESEKK